MTYVKAAALHARRELALSAALLWQLAANLIGILLMRFLWQAIYAGRAVIAGMTLKDVLTYFFLSTLILTGSALRADRDISRGIQTGAFAARLFRPVHPIALLAAEKAGAWVIRLTLICLPLLSAALFVPLKPPASPGAFALFLACVLLSLALNMNIDLLAGQTALYTRGAEGVTHAKDFAVRFFSGGLLPLAFFPSALRGLCGALPFRLLVDLPVSVYLSGATESNLLSMLAAALWCCALTLCNAWAFRAGIGLLTIYGG